MNKLIALTALTLITACAPQSSICDGQVHVWKPDSSTTATVVSSRRVELYESCNNSYALAGIAGAVGGPVLSGMAGGNMEQEFQQETLARRGIEYAVELPNGERKTTRQHFGMQEGRLEDGERVRFETSGAENRVLPAGTQRGRE